MKLTRRRIRRKSKSSVKRRNVRRRTMNRRKSFRKRTKSIKKSFRKKVIYLEIIRQLYSLRVFQHRNKR